MRNESTEVNELESMVGIHNGGCRMCQLNDAQVAMLKDQRDASEMRANRFKEIADEEAKRREKWRFWFFCAAAALAITVLKWLN